MSAPAVIFAVSALGPSRAPELDETLRSIAACAGVRRVAIMVGPESLDEAASLLNSVTIDGTEGPAGEGPSTFNKCPHGVPAFCLGMGAGEVRRADVLNALLDTAWGGLDIFVPLEAGDVVEPEYVAKVTRAFEEDLGVIGAVLVDRLQNGFRVHEQPWSAGGTHWNPPGLAIARYVFERVGRYVSEADTQTEAEFNRRMGSQFMITSLPEQLLRVRR